MTFEWDDKKNEVNYKKHGIKFEEAIYIFKNIRFTIIDDRKDYGETRKITIGEINKSICIVVVYTERNNTIRIISARKANLRERSKYYEHIKKKNSGNH